MTGHCERCCPASKPKPWSQQTSGERVVSGVTEAVTMALILWLIRGRP